MDKVQSLISNKFKNNELGHFYIVVPQTAQDSDFSYEWTVKLVQEFLQYQNSKTSVENHEDVLILTPEENKSYQMDDIQQFLRFLTYKANSLSRKFVIINHAEKLSTIHLNKLLKTFEDPPIECSIFLINNQKATLLQTVESRAIKLQLAASNETPRASLSLDDYLQQIQDNKLSDFMDKLKSNPTHEEALIQGLLQDDKLKAMEWETITKVENFLKEYQQDKLFHNTAAHRYYSLFHIYQQIMR